MQIVTLTMNPAIDVSVSISHVAPDRKLRCSDPVYDPGGGGINVARVVRTLGRECLAVYTAGGATGQQLDDLLKSRAVERKHIPIAGRTREDITVLEETSGQLYRLVMPGPELTAQEQIRCLHALEELDGPPEYVVISGSLPPGVPADFYRRVVRILKPRGARVIVDTKSDALKEALQEGVFLIKPNLRELGGLAGRDLDHEKQQEQLARDLVTRGQSDVVVVSLGAAGVLLVSQDTTERIRAPSVPIRSKVGAGDSTVGGITFGLAQGMSLRDAVRYGMAAGSATVMTPGTQLCRREDVEELFEEIR
jgi:6-phosphofructokinase 2